MKEHVRAQWMRTPSGGLFFFPGAEIPAAEPDILVYCEKNGIEVIRIPRRAYVLLKNWILENDPDRIVMSNRGEDVKLIHRLVDVIELQAKSGAS